MFPLVFLAMLTGGAPYSGHGYAADGSNRGKAPMVSDAPCPKPIPASWYASPYGFADKHGGAPHGPIGAGHGH